MPPRDVMIAAIASPLDALMNTLHWQVHPGNGPYLLLVHGFLSSRAQWTLNLQALAEVCQPVTVELWGHGRSPEATALCDYTPDSYLRQFEVIRSALGAQQWLLCGQSLGAALTLRYALTYPQHVIGQVFTNSNSALATEAMIEQRKHDAKAAIADIRERGLAAVEALRVHPRHAKRLPESAHTELLADAALINPQAIANSYEALNPIASVRPQVRNLTVPTAMAVGVYEKRFTLHREFAEREIPALTTWELEAGHAVNIQDADQFNRLVPAFFQSCLADL
jgi:2-succinyl-6-hydroxy-2,4-cyclohexadiene-1-carboxylate synthase